jgi:hypothetical protein
MDYYFTSAFSYNFELVWGEMCCKGIKQKWKHKMWLMSRYNDSPTTMGWIPLKSLVMVKRQVILRTCAIRSGKWLCAIWKQSWNNWWNPFIVSFYWKLFERCSKTILERPLVDKMRHALDCQLEGIKRKLDVLVWLIFFWVKWKTPI